MSRLTLKIVLAAASVALFNAPAAADDFSFTGTLNDPNQVLLFNFVVGAPSTVTLRTYSYAGGTNAAGTAIPQGGFDPILALFDSSGLRINQNDDGGLNVPADAVTGARFDTFLQSLLAPGTYTVSVMAFSNFSVGPNLSDGFYGGGSFNSRTNAWAFDVLNVSSAVVQGVPEPSTWAMMFLGFGAMGLAIRRRRRAEALPA
jgi:hypothetical protein